MKKNILGGLVIMFVTLSLFLMIDMFSKGKDANPQLSEVEVLDSDTDQKDLATTDTEEED